MSTFITKLDAGGSGIRVAVKDIIDVAGVVTTAGCRAVADRAEPATRDASCLAGSRGVGARLVGKANLQELAMLPIGTNPWFGTPINPLDAERIPGGSSSGSAVAVVTDQADVAFGSDTGGSIRIPSACCGTVGLKTTHGRIPLDGVWPLAPSLDTVGPMATTVAGTVAGMQLLQPGFTPAPTAAGTIGRIRTNGDPAIEAAIDAVLAAAGFDVVSLEWDGLELGGQAFIGIFFSEVWDVDHALVAEAADAISDDTKQAIAFADTVRGGVAHARRLHQAVRASLSELFDQVELLALPTLPTLPPRLDEISSESLFNTCMQLVAHVAPFNVAGVPCTAQPVPVHGSRIPASLQLVAPHGGEELLLATAATIEAATQ